VLIIPPSYFARDRVLGGGERYAMEYAKAMASLTPTTLGLFDLRPARETDGELTIQTFTVRHFEQRRGFPLTLESWRALGNFDVVHVHVFPTPMADLIIPSARARGQTVVLTDHGGGGPCWSTYLGKLHPRLSLNRLAHGLAFQSLYASRFFADWPHPSTIVGGGVKLPPLREAAEPRGYALFVGRLLPHKGVLELIQAIGPHTPLRVVGRPYDTEYLQRLRDAAVGKRVEFVLDASDADLERQYAGASVVVMPSLASGVADKTELLGLVALEAMAAGKPVIVTRTSALPDSVIEGETGFVVEPFDPAALRHRIEVLLGDDDLSRRMGAAARRHVEANFTWKRVAERGHEFYERLRSNGARGRGESIDAG
jgi:glycosyltransferase involved in cell wall biosynthesis